MENEFKLLCSNKLYLKKDFTRNDFFDNISSWVASSFKKTNEIIREHNELIYEDDENEESLQINISSNFAFVRFDNHQKDEESRTYRVDFVFDVLHHLLQIELYCNKPSSTKPPKIIREIIESGNVDIDSYDFPINEKYFSYSDLKKNTRDGKYDFDMPFVICNKNVYDDKKNHLYESLVGFAYIFITENSNDENNNTLMVKYHIPGKPGVITDDFKYVKKHIYNFHKSVRDTSMVWRDYPQTGDSSADEIAEHIYQILLPAKKHNTSESIQIDDKTNHNSRNETPSISAKKEVKSADSEEPDYEEEDFFVSTDEKKSLRKIKRLIWVNDKNFQRLVANKGTDLSLREAVINRLTELSTLSDEDLIKTFVLHHYEKLAGDTGLASLCAKSHKDSYRILIDYNVFVNEGTLKIIDFGPHNIYDDIRSDKYKNSTKDSYFIFDINNPLKLSSLPYLNEEQKSAAYYEGCPTLTKGCAGSGKTSVSVEKYNYLYECGKNDLVYLTYNEKLSIRIEKDLHILFGEEVKDVHVRTVTNFFREFIEDECRENEILGKKIIDFSGRNGEKTFSVLVNEYNGNLKQSGKKVPKEIISMCPNNEESVEAIANIVSPFYRGIYKGGLQGFVSKDYLEKINCQIRHSKTLLETRTLIKLL